MNFIKERLLDERYQTHLYELKLKHHTKYNAIYDLIIEETYKENMIELTHEFEAIRFKYDVKNIVLKVEFIYDIDKEELSIEINNMFNYIISKENKIRIIQHIAYFVDTLSPYYSHIIEKFLETDTYIYYINKINKYTKKLKNNFNELLFQDEEVL